MRREAPILAGVVVVALVLSFLTGTTAPHRPTKPVGSAPVVARTFICPAVNGLPHNTVSTATLSDVGSALPIPLHGTGTVRSTVLLGPKSVTSTLNVHRGGVHRERDDRREHRGR
jgi:hypothetical protein